MTPTPRLEEFVAMYASDIEDTIEAFSEHFHRLLNRTGLHPDDPLTEELQAYLVDDSL